MEKNKLLETLDSNVELLLQRCQALEQENAALKKGAANLREEILASHKELVDLQQRYKNLQIAHAMVSDDAARIDAKKQITKLIQMVDKCLKEVDV